MEQCYEKFREHEQLQAHKDATTAYIAKKQRPVSQKLLVHSNKTQNIHRESLLKQIPALRYLLRQGLALRNDNGGGFQGRVSGVGKLCQNGNPAAIPIH